MFCFAPQREREEKSRVREGEEEKRRKKRGRDRPTDRLAGLLATLEGERREGGEGGTDLERAVGTVGGLILVIVGVIFPQSKLAAEAFEVPETLDDDVEEAVVLAKVVVQALLDADVRWDLTHSCVLRLLSVFCVRLVCWGFVFALAFVLFILLA